MRGVWPLEQLETGGFGPKNGAGTKGGEALLATDDSPVATGNRQDQPAWHVLWAYSHCEHLVHDQLAAKGFHVLLPKVSVWARQFGIRRLAASPMFPGYLFLHHAMDKASYLEVRKVRGLVRVLGERWDQLSVVPDEEIEAIQTVLRARLPILPHPYLREGQRVRIKRGPMTDVEGILVRVNLQKGLLVLSVNLLQRSVAVQVDCTQVTAA